MSLVDPATDTSRVAGRRPRRCAGLSISWPEGTCVRRGGSLRKRWCALRRPAEVDRVQVLGPGAPTSPRTPQTPSEGDRPDGGAGCSRRRNTLGFVSHRLDHLVGDRGTVRPCSVRRGIVRVLCRAAAGRSPASASHMITAGPWGLSSTISSSRFPALSGSAPGTDSGPVYLVRDHRVADTVMDVIGGDPVAERRPDSSTAGIVLRNLKPGANSPGQRSARDSRSRDRSTLLAAFGESQGRSANRQSPTNETRSRRLSRSRERLFIGKS